MSSRIRCVRRMASPPSRLPPRWRERAPRENLRRSPRRRSFGVMFNPRLDAPRSLAFIVRRSTCAIRVPWSSASEYTMYRPDGCHAGESAAPTVGIMRTFAPSLSTIFSCFPSTKAIRVAAIPRVPVIQRSISSLTTWMPRRRSRSSESLPTESLSTNREYTESVRSESLAAFARSNASRRFSSPESESRRAAAARAFARSRVVLATTGLAAARARLSRWTESAASAESVAPVLLSRTADRESLIAGSLCTAPLGSLK